MAQTTSLSALSHPDYLTSMHRWWEYRLTYWGGEEFLRRYLIRLDDEDEAQWIQRKENTPIPAVAKEAVKDVRRTLTLRMVDIARNGGSQAYQAAVAGEGPGIDREGQSMNMFIGHDVLTELLVMGRVGVFVDSIAPEGDTMADGQAQPYAYSYPVEDILNWRTMRPDQEGTFSMVLLRDYVVTFNQALGISFPSERKERLRLVWLGEDGFMRYKFLVSPVGAKISDATDVSELVVDNPEALNPQLQVEDDGTVVTQLREIPFIMPRLDDSLLSDVASYQRLLLNVASNEGMFAIHANNHILAIQKDTRAANQNWKKPPGGSPEPGGQRSRNNEVRTGVRSGWVRGRYYSLEESPPVWVGAPIESLKASREYRAQLSDEVRHLVNVAISSQVGQRTESRETRELSAQGLEAGLHFIASRLQQTERQIAKYFAMYEGTEDVATVVYPKRFNLKSQTERIKDASDMIDTTNKIAGQEAKKDGMKAAYISLFTGVVTSEQMETALKSIDAHPFIGDIDTIMKLQENGMLTKATAAGSQDVPKAEIKKAEKEQAEDAARIMEAQTSDEDRMAARGVPQLDPNKNSGADERGEDEQKRGAQKAKKDDE